MTDQTREAWLTNATLALKPILREGEIELATVRVSCGWPARRALSRNRSLGECWHGATNKDGKGHIFVSPFCESPIEVLGILLHELTHAALPFKVKHGRQFAAAVHRMGLEGKPTHTTPGQALIERLNREVIPTLGEYPHQAIDGVAQPKQTTRMRLYECQCLPDKEADITNKVRSATDNLQATCDRCGAHFVRPE